MLHHATYVHVCIYLLIIVSEASLASKSYKGSLHAVSMYICTNGARCKPGYLHKLAINFALCMPAHKIVNEFAHDTAPECLEM